MSRVFLSTENRALRRKNEAVMIALENFDFMMDCARSKPTYENKMLYSFCTRFLKNLIRDKFKIEDWMTINWSPYVAKDKKTIKISYMVNGIEYRIVSPLQITVVKEKKL